MALSLELDAAAVVQEAEAFLAFEARCGLPRPEAWRRWSQSKFFAPEDAERIAREVRRQRVVAAMVRFGERSA
jgi:hypothetical protein